MELTKAGCCKTKVPIKKKANAANGSMSFLSTLLLIVLPKCPLCMTAYMSALVMFFDIEYAELIPILLHAKPVIGVFIMLLILFNRKDKRTWVALGIALVAWLLLLLKTYYQTAIFPDVILYLAFIFAIWYNGNFRYFYRFLCFGKQHKMKVG